METKPQKLTNKNKTLMMAVLLAGAFTALLAETFLNKLGIKKLSFFGYFVLLLGTLPMLSFNAKTSLALIASCYTLRMVGIAFTMMTTFTAGINLIDPKLTAHANAASSTLRQIGGSLGTALAMLVVTIAAGQYKTSPGLGLTQGFHWSFILMLLFALVGFIASFFLPSARKSAA